MVRAQEVPPRDADTPASVDSAATSGSDSPQPLDLNPHFSSTVSLLPAFDESSSNSLQSPNTPPQPPEDDNTTIGLHLLRNLATDQKTIWLSPFHLTLGDAGWLLPLAEVSGASFDFDRSIERAVFRHQSSFNRFNSFSNYGLAAVLGGDAGLYLWGHFVHDDHKKETGTLAGEAVVDSLGVNYALQYSLGRARPGTDNNSGAFFQGGTSFPSNHAIMAWSAASVIAHEYPGPLTEVLAYGAAAAISTSRVLAGQHFSSDVVVGSAVGWLIGREVYRLHHDPELGGGGWNPLSDENSDAARDFQKMGSPAVPLDSWVYPVLQRLAALGYITSGMQGLQPWTRLECARLLAEANDAIEQDVDLADEAESLIDRLNHEFAPELKLLDGSERNRSVHLESLYARAVSISGPDLSNSFNFGQTIAYDYGRPFERGLNWQSGGSFSAVAGPLSIFVQAEYQHAPAAPPLPEAARFVISYQDQVPMPAATTISEIQRPRLMNAYVGVNVFKNWEVVMGKQSLSWGPTPGGSLIMSNNAEPINMVRIVNPHPYILPSFLHYFGEVRVDEFFGRLQGASVVRRPFLYGQKLNMKPFSWLELGFGRTVTIGGSGELAVPITTTSILHSLFGITVNNNGVNAGVPGDSRSSMDWVVNIPRLGHYVVLYGEGYADDDPLPIVSPSRGAWRPGLYFPHIPHLPKLDLHIEATSTEAPGFHNNLTGQGAHGDLNYWNSNYRDGYTNNGFLIGNAIGRMGNAYQGWLTYWFSARNTLQLVYKNSRIDQSFIPGGGAWQDYSINDETYFHSGFYIKTNVQYEHITNYPILFAGPQHNITAIVEAGFSFRERDH